MLGTGAMKITATFLSLIFALLPMAEAQCYAPHPYTGQRVVVRERNGWTPFWAQATVDYDGWPVITYSPTFYRLPDLMQRFTVLHECGHHNVGPDEFAANCAALQAGRFSSREVRAIADYHRSVGPLGPQYGGSGANFWARTIRYCPALAR